MKCISVVVAFYALYHTSERLKWPKCRTLCSVAVSITQCGM